MLWRASKCHKDYQNIAAPFAVVLKRFTDGASGRLRLKVIVKSAKSAVLTLDGTDDTDTDTDTPDTFFALHFSAAALLAPTCGCPI